MGNSVFRSLTSAHMGDAIGNGIEDDYVLYSLRYVKRNADEHIFGFVALTDDLDDGFRQQRD